MTKYNTPDDHVPGFKKQKSVTGAYVSDDNSTTNPLSDDQLVSKKPARGYDAGLRWTEGEKR
jgi:hypothetical protein